MTECIKPQLQKLKAVDWLTMTTFNEGYFDGHIFSTNVSVLHYVQKHYGDGPSLHRHEYDEIFVVLRGNGLFKIGDRIIEASAGDVLFGPARLPHKFKNNGIEPLETLDIHLNDRWIQENLKDLDEDW